MNEIFEREEESFDPITGEKIIKKKKFVYRFDPNTGEKIEKEVIRIDESFDPNNGEKIIEIITEDDLKIEKEPRKIEEIAGERETAEITEIAETNDTNFNNKGTNFKFSKKAVLSIASLVVIILIGGFLINLFKSPQTKTINALKNTINLSIDGIDEVFGVRKFYDTILSEKYTFSVDAYLGFTSFGLECISNGNKKQLKINALNDELLNAYSDGKDLLLSVASPNNNVYKINYEKLQESLENILDNYFWLSESEMIEMEALIDLATNKDYSGAITKFLSQLEKEYTKIFKQLDYEKLEKISHTIDDKDVKLSGYRFNISFEDFFDYLEATVKTIQNNEEISQMLLSMDRFADPYPYAKGYETDIQALINGEFLQEIKEMKQEFAQEYGLSTTCVTIDVYLYKNYIAKAEINFWDVDYLDSYDSEEQFYADKTNKLISLFYETKGGSYPLENAKFGFGTGGNMYGNISTSGSNTKDNFQLELSAGYGYYSIRICSIEYNKKSDEITLSLLGGMARTTVQVNELKPGKEIDISFNVPITSYFGADIGIGFINKASGLKKPSGNIIDILELDIDDIERIIEDFENLIQI